MIARFDADRNRVELELSRDEAGKISAVANEMLFAGDEARHILEELTEATRSCENQYTCRGDTMLKSIPSMLLRDGADICLDYAGEDGVELSMPIGVAVVLSCMLGQGQSEGFRSMYDTMMRLSANRELYTIVRWPTVVTAHAFTLTRRMEAK